MTSKNPKHHLFNLNSTERKSYNFYIPTGEDQNVKDRGGYPKGSGEMKEKERRV